MRELSISATLSFLKNSAKVAATSAGLLTSGQVDVAGKHFSKQTVIVGPTDSTLDKGAIGTIGFCLIKNVAAAGVPDAPVVTVTTAGTPGSTTRKYVVVANFADGSKSVSNEFTIATSNATLNGTNYDIVAWTDVGAATYDIYRTVSGGTPSTTGLIHSGSTTSPYNDQGDAGDSSSVPAAVSSNKPVGFSDASHTNYTDYQLLLKAGESNMFRFQGTNIHRKSGGGNTEIEFTLIED